jgi:hypothetical protein
LKLLAHDRRERERMLEMRLKVDFAEFPDQKISD